MPIFWAGNTPLSIAYGIDKILAHAMPTPVMHTYNMFLSVTNATLIKPAAPASKQRL